MSIAGEPENPLRSGQDTGDGGPHRDLGHTLTRLLLDARGGDGTAAAQLLPLLYDELRRLARSQMSGERADHTLQPTALVHEAYLRLLGDGPGQHWASRAHFFSAAAQAMGRILVEHARARSRLKRGGPERRQLPLSVLDLAAEEQDPDQILAVEDAVCRLEEQSPDVARVVRLRFYAGLSVEETAAVLNTSVRTVYRDWTYARAWLARELGS